MVDSTYMKYIYKRPNGSFQVRIYTTEHTFSYSSFNVNECVEARNNFLGYNPDTSVIIKHQGAKILIIDIETTPLRGWFWRPWQQNIYPNQLEKDWEILSIAWKWYNEDDVFFMGRNTNTEEEIVQQIWELFDAANIVVTFNGSMFDHRKINAKMLTYDIFEPSKYDVFDVLKTIRVKFGFTYNKQDAVAKLLGSDGKVEHEGMGLWLKCMEGDLKAWATMENYNVKDILDLELIYRKVRPWDTRGPAIMHYYNDGIPRCAACESENIERNGFIHTRVHRYHRWICKECGHQMRETKNCTPTYHQVKLVSAQ